MPEMRALRIFLANPAPDKIYIALVLTD